MPYFTLLDLEDRLADVSRLFQHPDRRQIIGKGQRKEPQEIQRS